MKEIRYFFVPDAATSQELPQEEATHALRVLRFKGGEEIFLMDGTGNFYQAMVTLASNKRCLYEIQNTMPQQCAWHGHIHLAIAPTKMMDRIEWMTEKATEIGFDELSFLNTKFTERKNMRVDRIDKIVVSAVKQSHKAWKPVVNPLISFREFIEMPRAGRKFICHCYEEVVDLAQNNVDEADAYSGMKVFWNRLAGSLSDGKTKAAEKMFFMDLAEKYLYDWSSPMRNDQLYLLLARAFTETGGKDERLEWRIRQLAKNQVGKVPADIRLTTRNGKKTSLCRYKADYVVVMFYQPDCIECRETVKRLAELKPKDISTLQILLRQSSSIFS